MCLGLGLGPWPLALLLFVVPASASASASFPLPFRPPIVLVDAHRNQRSPSWTKAWAARLPLAATEDGLRPLLSFFFFLNLKEKRERETENSKPPSESILVCGVR